MKKLLLKLILLSLLSGFIIYGYCIFATYAAQKYHGRTTADQILMSFHNSVAEKYNCYFLGNSRIYRNINPDMFPLVKGYNFAHDNDSYNQMYYKLLYLLNHGENIDYLFVGTDYFQFSFMSDTRNYIYSTLFPREYSADFPNGRNWLVQKKEYYKTIWENKQNCLDSCFDYMLNKPEPDHVNYQKKNGQYVVEGMAKGNETIDRDYSVLDMQYEYFKKILYICEQNDIVLYVIMPPLWEGETRSHTDEERKTFDAMIKDTLSGTPYFNNYINYSEREGLLPFTDFIDITHLTPEASDHYSRYLHEMIFE